MKRAADLAEVLYSMPRNTLNAPPQISALPAPRSPASALNNAATAAMSVGFNAAYAATAGMSWRLPHDFRFQIYFRKTFFLIASPLAEYNRSQTSSTSPSRGYGSNTSTPHSNSGGSGTGGGSGGAGGSSGNGGGGGGGGSSSSYVTSNGSVHSGMNSSSGLISAGGGNSGGSSSSYGSPGSNMTTPVPSSPGLFNGTLQSRSPANHLSDLANQHYYHHHHHSTAIAGMTGIVSASPFASMNPFALPTCNGQSYGSHIAVTSSAAK